MSMRLQRAARCANNDLRTRISEVSPLMGDAELRKRCMRYSMFPKVDTELSVVFCTKHVNKDLVSIGGNEREVYHRKSSLPCLVQRAAPALL